AALSMGAASASAGMVMARLRIVRRRGALGNLDARTELVLPVQLLVRSDVWATGRDHRAGDLGIPGLRGAALRGRAGGGVGSGPRGSGSTSRGGRHPSLGHPDRCRLAAASRV